MSTFRGIRLRITAFATLTVVVVLLCTGLVLVLVQERVMTDNIDEALQTQSENIEQRLIAGTLPLVIEQQGSSDSIAQVVFANTTVLFSTSNMVGQRPLEGIDGGRDVQHRTSVIPIDESRYRLLSRQVGDVVIHTGTPIDDVEEAADALRVGLAYAIPAVTFLLGLLIWVLVGRTLRPVETIRAQVAEISGSNLERHVPVPPTGDEIARLATTMNEMLARVQSSVERQQRFVADASHELRSPLTRVRTELEVDLDHPSTADATATHRSVLEEVGHLQQLIDDLLHLARADVASGAYDEVVELPPLIQHEVARVPPSAVRIGVSLGETAVRGDSTQLARLVRNLLDNAVRHARAAVAIACVLMGDVVRLTIDDDGPGIPLDERTRVFERFARLDPARTSGTGGTGLGLAIAYDIVERHGGTIGIESSPLGGARLVVHLLAAKPDIT